MRTIQTKKKFFSSKKGEIIFISLFLLLPFIIYKNIILGKSFFWDDALYLFYPQRNFVAVSFKNSVFPFWNPYILGGTPCLADIQTAIFYPFTLVLSLFTQKGVLNWWITEYQVIFHITLAGMFMYLLMKYLLKNKLAAFVSAISFMFSSPLILRSVQPVVLNSMIWLPLHFYFAVRAVEEKSYKFAIWGGVFWAIAFFSGYPQFVFMSGLLVAIYFLYRGVIVFKLERASRNFRKIVISFCLFFIIGAGGSAIQALPTHEFSQHTTRTTWTYEQACENSVRPIRYITLIVPKFFGSVSGKGENTFWMPNEGYWTYWEQSMYIGILTLFMAIIGLITRKNNINVKFFAFSAFLMLWIALGKYGYIYKIFYYLPIFGKFRGPSKFLYFFAFGIAGLAGYGIETVLKRDFQKKEKLFRPLIIILGILTLFALLSLGFNLNPVSKDGIKWCFIFLVLSIAVICLCRRASAFLGFIISGVIILELFYANWGAFEGKVHMGKFFSENRITSFLESEEEYFRVNARKGKPFLILPRNQGCFSPIFTLQGLMPLKLNCFNEFKAKVHDSRKFDLFNVKYKVVVDTVAHNLLLGFHPTYLPRVKIFHKIAVIPEEDKVIPYINSNEFDHRTTVVLTKKPDITLPDSLDGILSEAKIVQYGLNEILIETKLNANGILFLSENFYPAWQAWIDGEPREILCANYTFRAVPIEQGKHIVRFTYKSIYFTIGRFISLLTFLFVVGALVVYKRGNL